MKPCPECGEPPHYHSFCTRCAKLFRRPAKHWDRAWRTRAEVLEARRIAHNAQKAARERRLRAERQAHIAAILRPLAEAGVLDFEAMLATGLKRCHIARYCRQLGLPPFRTAPP